MVLASLQKQNDSNKNKKVRRFTVNGQTNPIKEDFLFENSLQSISLTDKKVSTTEKNRL